MTLPARLRAGVIAGAIGVAALCAWMFPQLRKARRLDGSEGA